MPRITRIKPTTRDPARLSIHVDGKFLAVVPDEVVRELNLAVDDVIDAAMLARIGRAGDYHKARAAAMRRLNRRAMSRRRLADKLRPLDFDPAIIEQVLDDLTGRGFLDDRALGLALIGEMRRAKPAGAALIRTRLMQRGLDRNLIDELIRETADDQDDRQAALLLAQKRLASLGRFDPPTRRRRLYGLLARRGFDPGVIQDVMDQLPLTDDAD